MLAELNVTITITVLATCITFIQWKLTYGHMVTYVRTTLMLKSKREILILNLIINRGHDHICMSATLFSDQFNLILNLIHIRVHCIEGRQPIHSVTKVLL